MFAISVEDSHPISDKINSRKKKKDIERIFANLIVYRDFYQMVNRGRESKPIQPTDKHRRIEGLNTRITRDHISKGICTLKPFPTQHIRSLPYCEILTSHRRRH